MTAQAIQYTSECCEASRFISEPGSNSEPVTGASPAVYSSRSFQGTAHFHESTITTLMSCFENQYWSISWSCRGYQYVILRQGYTSVEMLKESLEGRQMCIWTDHLEFAWGCMHACYFYGYVRHANITFQPDLHLCFNAAIIRSWYFGERKAHFLCFQWRKDCFSQTCAWKIASKLLDISECNKHCTTKTRTLRICTRNRNGCVHSKITVSLSNSTWEGIIQNPERSVERGESYALPSTIDELIRYGHTMCGFSTFQCTDRTLCLQDSSPMCGTVAFPQCIIMLSM